MITSSRFCSAEATASTGILDDDGVAVTAQAVPPDRSCSTSGNLWHGGGANRTDRPRLGVILEYVVSWLRPPENHCLAVPRRIARALPARLQQLLGYDIFPPVVGYVDGTHPRKVLDLDD